MTNYIKLSLQEMTMFNDDKKFNLIIHPGTFSKN